ncbi:hypothetical protein CFP71_14660 [Amycolatopsis thailandensis]|uniref:Uncharacterized protein n=2 Tax=Amycolatopsis thailandensis TaxID=589330 RepID=A0A229SBN5_9PSEU|nr:hypothetical protein CFP71_14660 [Amycolatopsis thailandensis]
MATWERFAAFELSDPEEAAVETVFSELIPEEVATWEWSEPVRWVTTIYDPVRLEPLIGIPVSDLIGQVDSFESGEGTVVSPEGTLMIAEFACRVNPIPILDGVIEEERKCREKTKRGESYTSHDGQQRTSDPDWEYRWYLERYRPRHELLRGWCGHRAVTMQERLAAAEAEVQRLDVLIARLIDQMKEHEYSHFAEIMERVHEEERITAANYRPVVDRPLKPSEIPVRYERATALGVSPLVSITGS